MIHLILGGARSGKSSLAEQLAINAFEDKPAHNDKLESNELFYLATSTAFTPADIGEEETTQYENMTARIQHHQRSRDTRFITIEEPLYISTVIQRLSTDQVLLLDCLTLWLSNCLMQGYDTHSDTVDLSVWHEQKGLFLKALSQSCSCLILVSNEVGQGIVPLGRLSRTFIDEAGWLHQDIARLADKVSFVTAGIEQRLK